MQQSTTIQKYPILGPGRDYSFLRQKGMEYIEKLGSSLWTDYNIHDPGITLLELLCYALTDLGHRTSFDIRDLLAVKPDETFDAGRQAFYTAREILTVNPWSPNDFRKLLINIEGIKNAWIRCKECACDDLYLYADCKTSTLQYKDTEKSRLVTIRGMYDLLLEFDNDDMVADLNSGKIKTSFYFECCNGLTTALIEMRLPSWQKVEDLIRLEDPKAIILKKLRQPGSQITSVKVKFISGNKNDNQDVPPGQLAKVLSRTFYTTAEAEFIPDPAHPSIETIVFEDIPTRIWFKSDSERKSMPLATLKSSIEGGALPGSVFGKYAEAYKKADKLVHEALQALHSHRNLCEDFCSARAVETEDIAVCADLEVEPDADIEAVLAEAYWLIDQYFSPDIKFYSLEELMDRKVPVDEIFDGPALSNGFLDNVQLESTNLKTWLYTSDIINLVMDIKGVKAVKNLSLAKYDPEGKMSGEQQSWEMPVSYNHQPRFYAEASKFLVYKNGLPFLPDKLELADTLQVIRGQNLHPKYSLAENDLSVPQGKYYEMEDYQPIQYGLPLAYGVGYDGLPGTASEQRKAQAYQLKAYLMFFEQLLVNYLAQLSHVKDIYSVDETVKQTYFTRFLETKEVKGLDKIYNGLDASTIHDLWETETEFTDRRNRFLDHLLARFAEQFADYALMLYSSISDKSAADKILIRDKIAFLRDLPVMSRDRARSFNYRDPERICTKDNIPELTRRISRMLGLDGFMDFLEFYEEKDTDGKFFEKRWRLKDKKGKIFLSSSTKYFDMHVHEAIAKAKKELSEVRRYIGDPQCYEIKKKKVWVVNLLNGKGEIIATRKQHFTKKADAVKARDEIINFAKYTFGNEKIYLVEHLLLRPRNKPGSKAVPAGDPLLTICIPADCNTCGLEDPYSFRLTVVLNGEDGLINSRIDFRRFAEDKIRREVPAHLGVKICWVSKEQLLEFEKKYCAWLAELAKPEPDPAALSKKLFELLGDEENPGIFRRLKSVYPQASLHDCADGDDENRVYLNQTII